MKEIKLSEVLALSAAGKDKKAIQEHYGLTNNEITQLYKHPKLKGLKPKSALSFTFIDDETETIVDTTSIPEISNEVVSNTDTINNEMQQQALAMEARDLEILADLQEELNEAVEPELSINTQLEDLPSVPVEPVSEEVTETKGVW
jgi:hypothetical protein